MKAVCTKCGDIHARYDQVCPACGARPAGDGLLVAWLLSSENLGAEELEKVAVRIASGETIRPSARQLDSARRARGEHLSSDPGMTVNHRVALLATSLLLTPLVGWTLWFHWRGRRPRAAIEALALSLPATVLFFLVVPMTGLAWAYLQNG